VRKKNAKISWDQQVETGSAVYLGKVFHHVILKKGDNSIRGGNLISNFWPLPQ